MYVLRRRKRIEIWTPAKLNLFLEVLGRRADGYHEIETLMVPVNLYDTLRFWATEDDRIELTCRGGRGESHSCGSGDLPPVEQNLVYRAATLLRQRSGLRCGLRVLLVKRIPPASGLGGGSSDAAAALVGANLVWGLHWATPRLAEVGAELGSDVPFFLRVARPFAVVVVSGSSRCGAVLPGITWWCDRETDCRRRPYTVNCSPPRRTRGSMAFCIGCKRDGRGG